MQDSFRQRTGCRGGPLDPTNERGLRLHPRGWIGCPLDPWDGGRARSLPPHSDSLSGARVNRVGLVIASVLATLASVLTGLIAATGYVGVAVLMALESACIPLPSEVIMPFAGSLVPGGRFSLPAVATAGANRCSQGSTLAYWVGSRGGRPAVERWGAFLLLSPADLDWSERFFERWGSAAVFVSRILPVVRTFISLPAGIARMPLVKFQAYTFVGSWLWCFALASVGAFLGEAWNTNPTLKSAFHRFDLAIVVVGVIALSVFVWHRVRGMRSAPSR